MIWNNGTVGTGSGFKVHWFINGPNNYTTSEDLPSKSTLYKPLDVSNNTTTTFLWDASSVVQGNYTVGVFVDSNFQVTESNESNNLNETIIPVKDCTVDFQISGRCITQPGAECAVAPGESAEYLLNVTRTKPTDAIGPVVVVTLAGEHPDLPGLGYTLTKTNSTDRSWLSNLVLSIPKGARPRTYTLTLQGNSSTIFRYAYPILVINEPLRLNPLLLVYRPGENVATNVTVGFHGKALLKVSSESRDFSFKINQTSLNPYEVKVTNGTTQSVPLLIQVMNTTNPISYEINVSLVSEVYPALSTYLFLDLEPCSYRDFCAIPLDRAWPLPEIKSYSPPFISVLVVSINKTTPLIITLSVHQVPSGVHFSFRNENSTIQSSCKDSPDGDCWVVLPGGNKTIVALTFTGQLAKQENVLVHLYAISNDTSSFAHLEAITLVGYRAAQISPLQIIGGIITVLMARLAVSVVASKRRIRRNLA